MTPLPESLRREMRRTVLRGALWMAGALVVLAGVLYGVFWLPYQSPAQKDTRLEEIRRMTVQPVGEGETPPRGYSWVDREAEIVRIPLEEAMAIQTERLRSRPDAEKRQRERQRRQIPTDAGSGRFPERAGEEDEEKGER